MEKSLVDTDILSEYLRGKNVQVRDRAREYIAEHGRLAISVVTVFEVVRGRHQASQIARAARFLAWIKTGVDVFAIDAACAARAGEMAGEMQRAGTPLAVADVIIGATAIVTGRVLVTGNAKHFERLVPFGLSVQNWRIPVS
jgi:tRNA(fMet)-specific endonuclease VapC